MTASLILAAALLAQTPGTRVDLGDEATMFVPEGFKPPGGVVDVLVHLHGAPATIEAAFLEAKWPGVLVEFNRKGLSSVYTKPFADRALFPRLLENAIKALNDRNLVDWAKLGRVAVSSFSAGFGGVREILKVPENVDRIDALIMADSIYAGYEGDPASKKVDPALMAGFREFARRAASGSKTFVVTHSAQIPPGYASTTETADDLIRSVRGEATAGRVDRGGGWVQTREFRKGGLHVVGYEGGGGRGPHAAPPADLRDLGVGEGAMTMRWKPPSPRKPTLRVTLTTITLTLTMLTVASLGYSSYRNARFTADDLSEQILDQNSRLVDAQVNALLMTAAEHCQLNLRLLESGLFDGRKFPDLARFWIEVMGVHPRLTRMQVGFESDGEWSYVHSTTKGDLFVGGLRNVPGEALGRFVEYRAADYPTRPSGSRNGEPGMDPRIRPWYVAARNAGALTWVETYDLLGSGDVAQAPGVTCAAPIIDADGEFQGVISASFDVIELSRYLRGLRVGERGEAFVIEVREDETQRLIAHPDPGILVRDVVEAGRERRELVPIAELADRRIPAFLAEVPEHLRPGQLRGMERVRFVEGGVAYLGAFRRLSSKKTPDWLIGIMVPEREVLARVEQSNLQARLIGLVVVIAAVAVSLAISRQVARPLERVARETEAIGRLSLAASPVAHSIVREVDRLAVAVEETKTSLRSFGKYVPTDLLRLLVATGQEAELGGERRRMTVSFCDLANFTGLAEGLDPEELVLHIGEYFQRLSADVTGSGGTVDKFIGDAIMAFWGAPVPSTNHATAACLAALRARATMTALRARWALDGKPLLSARIGVQTGEVLVGNIGSPARFNYTVMGDPVNVASRLEGLNKHYGTDILIGESTHRDAAATILARPVDRVSVKGKLHGLTIYEPLALRAEATDADLHLADLAGLALDRYSARDWASAIGLFDEIRTIRPDDEPAAVLIARCRAFRAEPPPDDWDGVHHMASK